jgi:hypothetical protein
MQAANPTRIPDIVSSAPQLLLSNTSTLNPVSINASDFSRIDYGAGVFGALQLTDAASQSTWRVNISMRLNFSTGNDFIEVYFQLYNIDDTQTSEFTIWGTDTSPYSTFVDANGNASISLSDTILIVTSRMAVSAYLAVHVKSTVDSLTLSSGKYSVTMEPLFLQ